ncbi:MAG: hypothetical protein WBA93_36410 [Microcoleaceae cyanobacterium]
MNEKPTTIHQYKKALRKLSVEIDQIREFGDLRKNKTWETAYASCSNNPSHEIYSSAGDARNNSRLTEQERNLLFGPVSYKADETGQLLLFDIEDDIEPPDPDDYPNDYEWHYQLWAEKYPDHAQALRRWAKGDSPEPVAVGPAIPIYYKGTWKPIVDDWEVAEFHQPNEVTKRVRKFYQDVDYIYPTEFLMVCFHTFWKIRQTLVFQISEKVTMSNHEKRLFIEIDARYERCAWIGQDLRPFIRVIDSKGGTFCRLRLKNRTNINRNYPPGFKVFAKADDVTIERERPPP